MDDTAVNPFLEDLFVDHSTRLPGVARIHQSACSQILDAVTEIAETTALLGRLILVAAPGAGYGKSHLVARVRESLGSAAPALALPFDRSRPATWPVALASVLRQFTSLQGSVPHQTLFEEFSRRFLSRLIIQAIRNGALEPKNCPESPERVRDEYATLLAVGSTSKLLDWTEKHASELIRTGGPELARRLGMSPSELGFWTRLFLSLNLREEAALESLRGLSNGEAKERLLQLLRVATDHRPLVMVADGLDGFHRSETAGMEIAEIVTGIREKVPRSVTILCANDDLWASAFAPKLPAAWLDRLDGETLRLHPISPETATELVLHRLNGTHVSTASAAEFAQRLASECEWQNGEPPLFPRRVLRQAADLWRREGSAFLPSPDVAEPIAEEEIEVTEELISEPPVEEPAAPAPEPAREPAWPTSPPPLPAPVAVDLAGIDSIINDIRGTGKTVVSESPGQRFGADDAPTPAAVPKPAPSFEGFSMPPRGFGQAVLQEPLTRAALEQELAAKERELLAGPALVLDLERLSDFIHFVGSQHPALGQQEERYPSSRTVCLRWTARSHSVLTGFESPRNVYFWNNLLQQSLASNRHEKIAAFSHASQPFDPSLFASFGFSPSVIRGRIDVIEMNDRELAMIYAADETLRSYGGSPDAERATQLVTLHLDPLWRRIIQPL